MVVVLPELALLVAFVLALAMCVLATKFTEAVFGALLLVTRLPLVGSLLGSPLRKAERKVNSTMAGVVAGLESGIAASWHVTAHLIAGSAHLLVEMAQATAHVAWLVEVRYPLAALQAAVNEAGKVVRVTKATTTTVVQKVTVIEKAGAKGASGTLARSIRAVTNPIAADLRALDRWTRVKVAQLEHAGAIAVPGSFGGARARERAIERDFADLKRWVKARAGLVGTGALAAAVAVAIGKLGGSWIRCSKVGQAGRAVCAMDPNLLDALLGGTLAVVGAISIRDIARGLQAVEGETVGAVRGFVREAG